MGTRARLAAYADSREIGLERLERALSELEGADRELSTWRRDSAVSDFNRAPLGATWTAGAQLCRMFVSIFAWKEASGGAFDPAIGALVSAWGLHVGGRRPTGAELARARAQSGLHLVDFNANACTLTRRAAVTLDVGAFGKGEALDRATALLSGTSFLIDLGGQVTVGEPGPHGQPWTVDVAHPARRDQLAFSLSVRHGSVATSGGSERDVVVGGRRVSHILDPRSGQPSLFDGSVTVWHERGLAADVLSTALYVMGPGKGLPWAASRGLSVAFLIPDPEGVRIAETAAFASLRSGESLTTAPE